jgi:hypothetical protein
MKAFGSLGYRKAIFIVSFILFGLVLGAVSPWFHRRYDQWFFLDIPGDFLYNYLSNHLLASVLAWAVLGSLLSLIFRPKVIVWIMGIYLVVFGGLWLWWEAINW